MKELEVELYTSASSLVYKVVQSSCSLPAMQSNW